MSRTMFFANDVIKQSTSETFTPPSPEVVPTICLDIPSFHQKLIDNKGLIIFKFGATWCKPCKVVEPHFNQFFQFARSEEEEKPYKIECVNIDVDDSFELYATMKRLRMVKGLPTFLAFYKGNHSYIAEDSAIGSDIPLLQNFFTRCYGFVEKTSFPPS